MIEMKILLLMSLFSVCMTDTSCGVLRSTDENEPEVLKEPFGAWPWHAAILSSTNELVASGSILSEWFVLTVAHVTFTTGTVQKTPNDLLIAMGIKELDDPQNYTRKSNVSSIIRYGGYSHRQGISDLALLKASNVIVFSVHISPICLWTNSEEAGAEMQRLQMSIVGWGHINGNSKQKIMLSEANVTLDNFEKCHDDLEAPSSTNYCFKSIGKHNICLESGIGGIYMKHRGTWYLKGMTTTKTFQKKSDASCEHHENLQYTELSMYHKWIEKHALPSKHNLLGIEDCGVGFYTDSTKQLMPPQQPWIAQLAYLFWGRFNVTDCHGVLIHPEFVVTSSKCTERRNYRVLLHVILGASAIGKDPYDTSRSNIQAIEISEHLFSKTSMTFEHGFDINVLRLARRADITDNVKPVCLPPKVESTPYYNMIAWNRRDEHPKQLKSPLMQAVPSEGCHSAFLKLGINFTAEEYLSCYEHCQISNATQTCVQEKPKSCMVPVSGGPLFYTKHDGVHTYTYLAGIRSFGPASCQDNIYEVFNDIISFREEIKELVVWKAWFDEDDDHVLHDFDDISHTVHFELDEEGNLVEENGREIVGNDDGDTIIQSNGGGKLRN
ncbi:polyserase-2 [Aedes albopictus]|uniref:Peptidase S1 domain-containing protein n=1 Tax=Aedes albopictus TaxID=7160 RepID=A0ABM1Y596_AEDAL